MVVHLWLLIVPNMHIQILPMTEAGKEAEMKARLEIKVDRIEIIIESPMALIEQNLKTCHKRKHEAILKIEVIIWIRMILAIKAEEEMVIEMIVGDIIITKGEEQTLEIIVIMI